MISRLKNTLKLFVYFLIDLLVKPSRKISPKSLLLIRLDGIGDYILFRNFIELLKKDKKYKNYSLTLLGNISWKKLSEGLDNSYIDHFIWIDRNKFMKNVIYRYNILRKLAVKGYEILLSPVYSREYYLVDNIVKLLNAKVKIGSSGDCTNIEKQQKDKSDLYYDILIPSSNNLMFEFNRNKEFFEGLLKKKIDIVRPTIKQVNLRFKNKLPKKYATIFIGASDDYKKWSIEKFIKIANYINSQYNYDIVLCSTSDDLMQASELEKNYNGKLINLVGKTSLIELIAILNKGELLLSNETSAPHIAVALDRLNIFVIYNGNHFGRFIPYPREITQNYHPIYHPEIGINLDDYKKQSNYPGFKSNLYIDDISFNMVKDKIDSILGSKYAKHIK